jgi:hypothetical protein
MFGSALGENLLLKSCYGSDWKRAIRSVKRVKGTELLQDM